LLDFTCTLLEALMKYSWIPVIALSAGVAAACGSGSPPGEPVQGSGSASSAGSGAQDAGEDASQAAGAAGSGGGAGSGAGGASAGASGEAGAGEAGAAGAAGGEAGAAGGGTGGATGYHTLAGWLGPRANADHHGRRWYLGNQQKDNNAVQCTNCHGADYNGGSVGVSCNNAACHDSKKWKACSFCHGTEPLMSPPVGVYLETSTNTRAVGRHVVHLTQNPYHEPFECTTCHVVPTAGDVQHALQYVPSENLSQPGHHGDVVFSGRGAGMSFDANDTLGDPVVARGTCSGGCHSDGAGGPPKVIAYWAGGAWTPGCGNCHDASPQTKKHGAHQNFACSTCHPIPPHAAHVNGKSNVLANPKLNSSVMTSYGAGASVCGNKVGCTGDCHALKCW
jgi:hypothetical protein